LRLYTKLFPLKHLGEVRDHLRRCVEGLKRCLGEDCSVYVKMGSYNPRARMLPPKMSIRVDLGTVSLHLLAQINYYDITEELSKRGDINELVELNLLAIGYRALEHFLDHLHT
ncbi:MAG: hypothetical protein B6U73_04295, partial [Desulfurococcales archaeon ex4484_204]